MINKARFQVKYHEDIFDSSLFNEWTFTLLFIILCNTEIII